MVEVASSSLVIRSIFWCHSQVVRQRTATPSPPVRIWVAPPKPSAYAGGFSYAGSCLSAFWKDNKKTWAGRPGPYHDRGQQPEPLSCITPGGVTPQLIRRGRPATRRVCERRDEPPFSAQNPRNKRNPSIRRIYFAVQRLDRNRTAASNCQRRLAA